jgi:hypothetical protein
MCQIHGMKISKVVLGEAFTPSSIKLSPSVGWSYKTREYEKILIVLTTSGIKSSRKHREVDFLPIKSR